MEQVFKTKQEALDYLKGLDKICLPSEFTYWCHSSNYKEGSTDKKMWSGLPTDEVVVRGELSLLSRAQRLEYAVERNSLSESPTSYARSSDPDVKPFQLKVVMPKMDITTQELKDAGKNDEQISRFKREKYGLGDNRHPKLSNQTQIHIFGFMDKDEMSQKKVETVFGVRDEDIIWYASSVYKELEKRKQQGQVKIDTVHLPKSREDARTEDNLRQLNVVGENLGKTKLKGIDNKEVVKMEKKYKTKQQILEDISEWLGNDWQNLERNGKMLTFKTKQERINYEYRRSTSAPKTATKEEKEDAWKYVSAGMADDRTFGGAFESLYILVNGLGEKPQEFHNLFLGSIQSGTNIEASIRQAYGFMSVIESMPQDDNTSDYYKGLQEFVRNVKANEEYSPYYELKDLQKQINNRRKRLYSAEAKDPKKHAKIEQEIEDFENQIADFMEGCDYNGLDREIAEEYLSDVKADLAYEERQQNAPREKAQPKQETKTEPSLPRGMEAAQNMPLKQGTKKESEPESDAGARSGYGYQRGMDEAQNIPLRQGASRQKEQAEETKSNARKVKPEELTETFKDIAKDIKEMFGGRSEEGPKVERVSSEEIKRAQEEVVKPELHDVDQFNNVTYTPEIKVKKEGKKQEYSGFERGR